MAKKKSDYAELIDELSNIIKLKDLLEETPQTLNRMARVKSVTVSIGNQTHELVIGEYPPLDDLRQVLVKAIYECICVSEKNLKLKLKTCLDD